MLEKSTEASKESDIINAKFSIEQFVARQKIHELKRKQNLECLSNNHPPRKFSPKINEKSEEIVSKMGDFFTRINRINLRRQPNSDSREDIKAVRQGRISPILNGAGVSPKVIKETPKNQPALFPALNKSKEYERVESKLQLRDNLDTLMLRIKYKKEQKEREYRQERCMRELEANIECTHKPKLCQSPKRSNTPRNINPELKLLIDKNTNKI